MKDPASAMVIDPNPPTELDHAGHALEVSHTSLDFAISRLKSICDSIERNNADAARYDEDAEALVRQRHESLSRSFGRGSEATDNLRGPIKDARRKASNCRVDALALQPALKRAQLNTYEARAEYRSARQTFVEMQRAGVIQEALDGMLATPEGQRFRAATGALLKQIQSEVWDSVLVQAEGGPGRAAGQEKHRELSQVRWGVKLYEMLAPEANDITADDKLAGDNGRVKLEALEEPAKHPSEIAKLGPLQMRRMEREIEEAEASALAGDQAAS